MKYLFIFCFFMVQNVFGQPIDCALLVKINETQAKSKTAMRTQTSTVSNFGKMESTMEMDAEKNMHMRMTMPSIGGMPPNDMETFLIKGISYTKNAKDSVWYYKALPPQDSGKFAESIKKIQQGKDCKIVGTETIDGKLLTIIESSILMEKISDKPIVIRSWVDLKDALIKKTETTHDIKGGMQMNVVSEYGITLAAIEKPLNAVPDSLRPKKSTPKRVSGGYSGKYGENAVVIPEQNPEFKEGQKALFMFLKNNLVYPQAAKDAKLEGTVYLKFIVETDGTITNLSVARGLGSGCDEAAMELIKKTSGNWHCAINGGKAVRSPYTLPVKFKL